MSRVTKIFGPPGTGKTSRLLKIVEDAMANGVRPERIAYMAFTKKAADEAIERAKERFGFSDDRMPWFRTLHSMAFRDLSVRRDDIMQDDHYKELGNALGFQFTSVDDDNLFIPVGTALGDKAARIEALHRLRGVSLEQQWYDSNLRDVGWHAVEQWSAGLARFKSARGLLDYTDLLEQYSTPIDVDIFIIDEAQDLSPLQWQVVKCAATTSKSIYLAGDDDQCIYGWAGADVGRFLRIRGTTEVLPVSFRLPRSVYRLAHSISEGIHERQPKDWSSRSEEGSLTSVMYESNLDLSRGEWMLLSRNHRFLSRFEEICQSQGYPYIKEGRHSTDNTTTKAILAWEHWRKGKPLPPKEVKHLSHVIPELEGWRPREDTLLRDAPVDQKRKKLNWMDALSIEPRRREYIRACLANREPLFGKPRITISTIHRAKGGEADHVALMLDVSAQPWYQLNTDEEQRVLYVGLTRARKSLTLIQPKTNMHYRL